MIGIRGINLGSAILKFGETFLVIGEVGTEANPVNASVIRVYIAVHEICGIVSDEKTKRAEVSCETLK